MKNLVLTSLAALAIAIFAQSCEPIESCKSCEAVTTDVNTGDEISRQDAVEYCGDELNEKENSDPIVIGNEKTEWVCN